MEIFRREEGRYFADYVFKKLENAFLSCAQHNVFHSPYQPRGSGFFLARQFRIGGNSGEFVPRQFYFGDNGYEAVGGILHYLLHFLLRIKAFAVIAFRAGFR